MEAEYKTDDLIEDMIHRIKRLLMSKKFFTLLENPYRKKDLDVQLKL